MKSRLGPYQVHYSNSEEYHRIKREVWGGHAYYVELSPNPTILDVGAHIGVATLYFKKLYPAARVISVEPIAENLELLEQNIWENQVDKVEIIAGAVSDHDGVETLYTGETGAWHSNASITPGGWTGDLVTTPREVPCRTLEYYLGEYKPELVKLDVEGAEERILVAAGESLRVAKHYLIEFHPVEGRGIETIIKLLEELGYEVQVWQGGRSREWQKVWGMCLVEARRGE